MKFVVLVGILALSSADTRTYEGGEEETRVAPKHIPILKFSSSQDGDGSYNFNHESGDGNKFEESGHTRQVPGFKEPQAYKSGSYSWISPEGIPFTVSYVADETGFHPQASHIPTTAAPPPAVPEDIMRLLPVLPQLEQLENLPSVTQTLQQSQDDRSYSNQPS